MTDVEEEWYWDRRTRTALRPRRIEGDVVEFVTVRHREAVEDAIASGVLEPLAETEVADSLEFMDSIRLEEP